MQRLLRTHFFRFSSLTHKQAKLRAQIIKQNSIFYNSHITLHQGTSYSGITNIAFSINQKLPSNYNLRIDFAGRRIQQLLVNSQLVKKPQQLHQQGFINLPTNYLRPGQTNNLLIQYTNNYDKDGNGCVSFTDVDQKQYLYTQFQPYYANRVFPLFDQPDLKAPLHLTIACPQHWGTTLSNEFPNPSPSSCILRLSDITRKVIQPYLTQYSSLVKQYKKNIPKQYQQTSFNPTQILPSYLYCFVVGPYKELLINKSMIGKPGYIPMKLYSIQSLYPQLQKLAPYIEETTVKSMSFFEKYFGYAYPFSKYDQVFAHQYKWGAMENAGIVTLNDLYLFKDRVSQQRMLSFGNTVVHELAHHWFGNLVTMKWWDDLWLNQSFAEYISHFCLEKIKNDMKTIKFQSAMLSFFNRKGWGYAEDQMVTTHAIRGEVIDTYTAQSIFDGITYSKGAATMKQLMYLIGQKSFSEALANYFHKYAFKNTELDDLLACMQPFFQKSNLGYTLQQWKQMWLERAGCNVLSCQWKAGGKAVIKQTVDRQQCPTLRLHRIKIAFIQQNHSIATQQVIVLPQAVTELSIDVPASTIAVLPNYQDLTFAKIQLDSASRSYLRNNLGRVNDSLSRALIWKAYYDMVKDCKITSQEYLNFVLQNIGQETSDPIVEEQLSFLFAAVGQYTPKAYRGEMYIKIHELLVKLLAEAKQSQQNKKVILRDKIIEASHSKDHLQILRKWYFSQKGELSTQPLNNSLRWKIVIRLIGKPYLTRQQKSELLADIKRQDTSDESVNKSITCETLMAQGNQQLTEIYLSCISKASDLGYTRTAHIIRGLNHEIHGQFIRNTMRRKYFEDTTRFLGKQVSAQEKWFVDGQYFQNFLGQMDPNCQEDVFELEFKIRQFKKISAQHNLKIDRTIKKKVDVLQRRKRAYEYFVIKESSK